MAINLNIADAVLTQTDNTATPTVTITAPNNIVEGDVILVCASIIGQSNLDGWDFGNLPAGFSSLQEAQDNNNWSPEIAIFAKVATASEPASYAFGIEDDWDVAAYALRVSGVDTSSIQANGESATTIGGTSLTFSGGDSTTSGNKIVYATALGQFTSPTPNQGTGITPPSGVTKELEWQGVDAGSFTAERIVLGVFSEDAATETIGTREFTWTNSDNAHGVWVELNEAQATFENTSPEDGTTGVSVTPTLEINNPDNYSNLNFRVSTSADFADTVRDLFETTDTVNITEALSASTQYHWNARQYTPGSSSSVVLYSQDFSGASAWDDFTEQSLQGTSSTAVTSGEGVISTDPNGQIGLVRSESFNNTDIQFDISFSDVSTDLQPTIHFRAQGTTWTNNFIPSYYVYFLGNEIRLGRVNTNNSASDFSGQSFTFSRTADTNYTVRIFVEDYRIRVAIWETSGSQSGYQIDYFDTANNYLSGNFGIKSALVSGASTAQTVTIDNIQISGVEGGTETQSVDSVSVSPTSATGDADSTVLIEGTILTSGGLSNAGTWSKVSGDADITIDSVSGNDLTVSIGANASDSDTATFELVADEDGTKSAQATVTAQVSENITGSQAGDESALEAISASLNLDGQLTGWADSGMSLANTIEGITTDTIGGELRVTRIDLFNKSIISTGGLPSLINNLTEMTYFNVMLNEISGSLPQFILPKCVYLYLNHSFDVQDQNDELHDTALGNTGGGRDVHPGKNDTGAKNKFTGELYVDCPSLEWIACAWTLISAIDVTKLFSSSSLRGIWLDRNSNLSGKEYSIPSAITNMTNLSHFGIGNGENAWGGVMPPGMSTLSNLYSLRISENNFTGALPDFSGTSMQTFSIGFNDFTSGWPIYFLNNVLPINAFLVGWQDQGFSDASFPTSFNNTLRTISPTSTGLSGVIPTLNTGVTVTEFSYNPGITGASENGRFLFRIRNLRWRDCSISGTLIELDWYNFYRQNNSHPLRNFSRFQIANNNYSSADLNADLDGGKFAWEIEKKGRMWYFENKYRNGSGDCNILTNVDPNFTKQDYLNAGFSQSTLDAWGGATGYKFMQNMLNDIFLDGTEGPGNGYANSGWQVGGQTP